jgi:hypothetical protein
MYRVGSALVSAATVPLALGLAGDAYVVMTKITASQAIAIAAAVAVFILLIGLWHAYPVVTAARRTHRGLRNQADALVSPTGPPPLTRKPDGRCVKPHLPSAHLCGAGTPFP